MLKDMAVLVLTNGKKQKIPRQKGIDIWDKMLNPADLDERQVAYLKTVKAVYLDWRTAPDSYITENLEAIIPMVIKDWPVNRLGRATGPRTKAQREFASKHGLMVMGGMSALVRKYL